MEIALIAGAAFLTSILTFFSGFGLGTLLSPVFMLFFPVDISIALTGIVHFFNNIFKLILRGKSADKKVLIQFGLPAIVAALLGAWLLINISELPELFSYKIYEKEFHVYPIKFIIAILLFIFALIDLLPYFNQFQFTKDKLPIGGFLSGFFGGLSGNQGALRSAFLIKAGLSKESFIGTTIVISTCVDLTRLSVYYTHFSHEGISENYKIILIAIIAAISGAFLGNKLLKKVTINSIQKIVGTMLILISIALGAGLI